MRFVKTSPCALRVKCSVYRLIEVRELGETLTRQLRQRRAKCVREWRTAHVDDPRKRKEHIDVYPMHICVGQREVTQFLQAFKTHRR